MNSMLDARGVLRLLRRMTGSRLMTATALITAAGLITAGTAQAAPPRPSAKSASLPIQLATSSLTAGQGPIPIAADPAKPVRVAGQDLAPAPVPDPDLAPPPASTSTDPRLSPALISRAATFEGNGFSAGSNQDYAIDMREQPAAGVNLSVPVK